jgi:hypothetical protein
MSVPGVKGVEGPLEAPQVLAFYLPQFHHVPENDAWHDRGFTEWSVVASSHPLYPGHRQPVLPGELGFYDLRVPETRYLQTRLAREHGITGFLYYHYWFGGRRMLGRPFQEVLESGQPDFPFALCWANESWYRRWQASNDEMLLEQEFSEEDDIAHIRWLIRCFQDPRYIRIEGRPLLAVYRPGLLPNPTRTVDLWRRECDDAGMEPPWLVMFETDDALTDPGLLGFDASAEFVPHQLVKLMRTEAQSFGADGSHKMYEYDDVASAYLNRPAVEWQRYPCVPTAWDNSPRRQTGGALLLRNSTPESYGRWLAEAATRQSRSAGRHGIVFVNAWNEWAEGAHLEPDALWGRAYLEVTRDVLRDCFGERDDGPDVAGPDHAPSISTEDLYHDLYEQFVALQQSSSAFLSYADRRIQELKQHYEAKLRWTNFQAAQITELNEWLVDQLERQADRMSALGLSDATLKEWLSLRPSVSRFGDRGKDDDDRDDHGKDPSPRNERGGDADADVSRGGRAADKDRPGNSGDHGPAQPVLPRWLVDVETAD